jgi:hypothetical protein
VPAGKAWRASFSEMRSMPPSSTKRRYSPAAAMPASSSKATSDSSSVSGQPPCEPSSDW